MKNSIYLIALALLFIFGCQSESPNSSNTARVPGSDLPMSSGDGADAVFDIPTPSISDGTVSGNSVDGFCIHLEFDNNAPGYAEGYSSYAQDPTSPTDLNDGHGWSFWGNTQLSIVIYNNGGNYSYSGHYELYRNGEKIADVSGDSYDDCNLAAGTYTYHIKAKSREQAGGDNNTRDDENTHHSQLSDGFEVSTCTEIPQSNSYAVNPPANGGNGTWNATGTTWTANSSLTNQNANIFYNINVYSNTKNSCTGEITTTLIGLYNTGDCWLSRDNGVTWRKSLAWSLDNAFHHNGNGSGGNGSGLGKFVQGSYNILISLDGGATTIGSFTLNQIHP